MFSALPDDWTVRLPDTVVTLLAALVAIRLLFSLVVPAGVDSRLYRALRQVTDVIVAPVRFVTPSVAGEPVVLVFTLAWLFIARFLLIAAAQHAELTPSLSLAPAPHAIAAAASPTTLRPIKKDDRS